MRPVTERAQRVELPVERVRVRRHEQLRRRRHLAEPDRRSIRIALLDPQALAELVVEEHRVSLEDLTERGALGAPVVRILELAPRHAVAINRVCAQLLRLRLGCLFRGLRIADEIAQRLRCERWCIGNPTLAHAYVVQDGQGTPFAPERVLVGSDRWSAPEGDGQSFV
jgi:hypothetical protein